RVENLSYIGRVAVAVERGLIGGIAIHIDGHDGSIGEECGEISSIFGLRRNRGHLRQSLANAEAFVVPKKEHFVLADRAAQGKSELVLLVGLLAFDVEVIDSV